MSDFPADSAPQARLIDYLRLFRLPNVFTAFADVVMGFVFVQSGDAWMSQPGALLALGSLVLASGLLYTAGMVLNDVYDVEVDTKERPQRPLPSGRIRVPWARFLGYFMLVFGVLLAAAAGWLHSEQAAIPWRPGAIALLLAMSVVLYDAVLKKLWIAPLAMGACRFFNVLLGMSVSGVVAGAPAAAMFFDPSELLTAGGIGLYIVGVTQFARNEAKESPRNGLVAGIALMAGGFVLLGAFPHFGLGPQRAPQFERWWPLLLLLLGATLLRRAVSTAITPEPKRVQIAVKQFIFSLIVLDASVCLAIGQVGWAIGIIALLAPMFLLGRYVYST